MYFLLSDIYYHNMLLTQQQLPIMWEIWYEFFFFQHDNVSSRLVRSACQCLSFSLLKMGDTHDQAWGAYI